MTAVEPLAPVTIHVDRSRCRPANLPQELVDDMCPWAEWERSFWARAWLAIDARMMGDVVDARLGVFDEADVPVVVEAKP